MRNKETSLTQIDRRMKDIDFGRGGFTLCTADPQSYKCAYNSSKGVTQWTIDGGDEHPKAGGEKILTTIGKITCPDKGGQISVMVDGQQSACHPMRWRRFPPVYWQL